ncbi:MAG: polysaccharide deacetylase family protein [Candidatus Eisenbacteria bacterium]|nr:polysaccharide deacetylase family protein [Candidatus Eisenbacteria bacterium]
MRESARRVVSRAVVCGGVSALHRRLRWKDGSMILYGHRVTGDDEGYLAGLSPAHLEGQITYLKKHYRFISLSELVACLREQRPVPRMSVVLTFDDGFRDNYLHAFPILKRHGVPATVFLTTGSVTLGRLPWSQRLGFVLQTTGAPLVPARFLTPAGMELGNPRERRLAYLALKTALRPLPVEAREDYIDGLAEALGVVPPGDRMVTWDQVREMQAAGIDFGAHTVTHAFLAELPPEDALREIEQSMIEVRQQTGVEAPVFAFPGGSWNDGLIEMVKRAGASGVCKPGQGFRVNSLATVTPFSLARTGILNGPAYLMEAELDGPFPWIRAFCRRCAAARRRHRREPQAAQR